MPRVDACCAGAAIQKYVFLTLTRFCAWQAGTRHGGGAATAFGVRGYSCTSPFKTTLTSRYLLPLTQMALYASAGGKRRACRREQGPPTPGPPHQVSTRGAPRLSSPPPARSRSAAASQAHLTQEHQRGGALGRQKTGMPAGAGPANPGPPSPGVYPRCPPPRLASDGALPQRRRLARSASSERQREGPRAAKDGRAGGSRARQPRGPLTRCLSEVPPASARLRRRAPALSRLCRGYQPTIAPWLFEGPRSRSSAKIREIYNIEQRLQDLKTTLQVAREVLKQSVSAGAGIARGVVAAMLHA